LSSASRCRARPPARRSATRKRCWPIRGCHRKECKGRKKKERTHHEAHEEHEGFGNIFTPKLRVLRGEISVSFGCDFAALGSSW
jgi:hypothetical protein